MVLTDTHSHLYAKEFQDDMDLVIQNALDNQVSRIFLPNIDEESIEPLKSLTLKRPDIFFPMMGLHPCSVNKSKLDEQLKFIKNELYHGKYIAVGETGIDLYWYKESLPEQEIAFREQIKWSLELDLPIVIHARESTAEILNILKDYPSSLRGVFHCFSGDAEQATQVLKRGMYIGLGGVLTFKNSNLKDIVKEIDMDYILLETDSPYLAPMPFRGKRNESSYILQIAQFLADIKNSRLEEVAKKTTENSINLFGV